MSTLHNPLRFTRPIELAALRRTLSSTASGFSLFSPRKLDQVMKLDMMSALSTDEIKGIWAKSQNLKSGNLICGDLDPVRAARIRTRAKKCPMFIVTAFKSEEAYITLLSQYQENFFVFTYLEEYKRNPTSARPWLQLTLYDELEATKALCLHRAEFTPDLTQSVSPCVVYT